MPSWKPRFGHDFSQVRIHADSNAANTSQKLNARAFTVGRNIAFGAGLYQPNTLRGRKLLAHELTHVVQQSKVSSRVSSDNIARKTEGEKATGRASDWLQVDTKLKIEVDVLKAAIREINNHPQSGWLLIKLAPITRVSFRSNEIHALFWGQNLVYCLI